MGGAVVGAGPVLLRCSAGAFCLKASEAVGGAARRCEAGQAASFTLVGKDARGNALQGGGAVLGMSVSSADAQVQGAVEDQRNGTYLCKYTLSRCGPFVINISSADSPAPLVLEGAFSGTCTRHRAARRACAGRRVSL